MAKDSKVMMFEIDHVQITAPQGCEREARAFFGELLGLPEIEKPEPLDPEGAAGFRSVPVNCTSELRLSFAPLRKRTRPLRQTSILQSAARNQHFLTKFVSSFSSESAS
jgi:hypothetical protein